MSRHGILLRSTFALIVCLLVGFALAKAPLTVDAKAVPFADEPSTTAVNLE